MIPSIRGSIDEGFVAWQAPSNIALVKYWGKYGLQLPCNPSLSMTLKNSLTITELKWRRKEKKSPSIVCDYFFEGKENNQFKSKIKKYLEEMAQSDHRLYDYDIRLSSRNTFPHSAGIASSASSMAALALCLKEFLSCLSDKKMILDNETLREVSSMARLGSGSACRSIFGGWVEWGDRSLEYASQLGSVHSSFESWGDSILIVDSKPKSVSSRSGHAAMKGHHYGNQRFHQARDHFNKVSQALRDGDIKTLIDYTIRETFELHGMMMLGESPFILMKPNTIEIINKLNENAVNWNFPWTYTLDAGPNIHLLYPLEYKNTVVSFISSHLSEFLEQRQFIQDQIGEGPKPFFHSQEQSD